MWAANRGRSTASSRRRMLAGESATLKRIDLIHEAGAFGLDRVDQPARVLDRRVECLRREIEGVVGALAGAAG